MSGKGHILQRNCNICGLGAHVNANITPHQCYAQPKNIPIFASLTQH